MSKYTKYIAVKNHWLYKRAIRIVGRKRLDEWKDRLAAYWELNIEKVDEKQLLIALSRLYGKKEGKKILRMSRSEHTKRLVEGEEARLMWSFLIKLGKVVRDPDDFISTSGLNLEEHDYSKAIILHEGKEYNVDVDGMVAITGKIHVDHVDGSQSDMTIFSRWLSHPFWQYTFSSQHCPRA
jgi:hypothetical protein